MTSVAYFNNMPSPYVVGRFNALADRGNLDFRAWFRYEREADRSWRVDEAAWRFQASWCPDLRAVRSQLAAGRPDVLVTLYESQLYLATAGLARAKGSRIVFRVLPTYDTWVPRRRSRELAKHALFRMIDAALVPGPDGAAYAQRYGVPPHRLPTTTQSIDVGLYSGADPADVAAVRASVAPDGLLLLYVGRLWEGKGVDHLLEAFRRLRAGGVAATLVLLGDGVDEARYRRAEPQEHLRFPGFVQAEDMPAWYAAADVVVFPTLGDPHGLVVEEAMAAGRPVVSTTSAGDIEARLVGPGAGLCVPPADPEALVGALRRLAADPGERERMGEAGRRAVADRDHQRWAQDFEAAMESVRRAPRRRPWERP